MVIKPPPLLLAASLLLWGWAAEFLYAAAGMAIALEAPRFFRLRWELSRHDFERIADLCTIAFGSALAFQFLQSRHFPDSLISVLAWLPMLFFALMLAQRFSTLETIPLSALFWSLRRRGTAGKYSAAGKNSTAGGSDASRSGAAMPLDYAYFCLCLLAASSANPRTPWFFAALSVLALYALWPAAPKSGARRTWALAFAAAVGLAFVIQVGLLRGQANLEEMIFEWLSERWNPPADPYRTRTAIGDIGELKTSDRIVLRVDAADRPPPHRLRAASYNVYAAGTWTAPGQAFIPITPVDQNWVLAAGQGASVRLSGWLEDDGALLALPLGTFRLESLNVAGAQRNNLGAVRVGEGPEMLRFVAHFDAQQSLDAAPDTTDLLLPSSLRPVLKNVADEIGLPGADPRAALNAVAAFFETKFVYSMALSSKRGRPRSLNQFLLEDRRGHCEYFATATVLLLRYAGIPARYATGYAVQEWSGLEEQYVVRKRHAHAWALAWIDGRWQEVDTTPAVWAAEEEEAASPLQPLYDLLSLLNYRLTLWQHADPQDSGGGTLMLWLAAALAVYLVWSIWRRRRVRTPADSRPASFEARAPRDPRIAALLQRLEALGYARPPGAPLLRWTRDLPLADAETQRLLGEAVRSYYRTRFDPNGSTQEREQMFDRQMRILLERLSMPSIG